MNYLLVIANSARMLAQMAKRVGFHVLVIDVFADVDTQHFALDYQCVTDLSIQQLAPVLDYFSQRYGVVRAIYGSGFEQYPDSLFYLQTRLTLLGNSAENFVRLHDKADFFAVLHNLNIPHPETRFTSPESTENWLIKPIQGQGGVGIERASLVSNCNLIYWQKYQQGANHSLLFLADGKKARIIGFNSQWTMGEFLFAGIINYCPLPKKHRLQLQDWLNKLIPEFQLCGINSLDFIHANGQNYLLEINPRLSASLQLYDARYLLKHINLNLKKLPKQHDYTGYQIVYAVQDVQIPPAYNWSKNYADLPSAGAFIRTGQPICSIITQQKQADNVLQVLKFKQLNLQRSLYGSQR